MSKSSSLKMPKTSTLKMSKSCSSDSVKSKKKRIKLSPRNTKISQIEIYDIINDDDLEMKQQCESTAINVHQTQKEQEEDFNDDVLQTAKRPYYALIAISVLFVAAFALYFIPTLRDYAQFNRSYLVPSSLAVLSTVPLLLCFRYFERKLVFQHNVIYRKIMEIFSLRNQLQTKSDENVRQKKYINDLKLAIKEQEIEIHKLSGTLKLNHQISKDSSRGLNLLHGFRKGIHLIYELLFPKVSCFEMCDDAESFFDVT